MRTLVAATQVTLDGVMQAPGGPEEDPGAGFEYGGWSVTYFDEILDTRRPGGDREAVRASARKTYEVFAAHWPYAAGPIVDQLNSATKHVASRTLNALDWDKPSLLEGDAETAVPASNRTDQSSRCWAAQSSSRRCWSTGWSTSSDSGSPRSWSDGKASVRR
jgi:hypothetical protein